MNKKTLVFSPFSWISYLKVAKKSEFKGYSEILNTSDIAVNQAGKFVDSLVFWKSKSRILFVKDKIKTLWVVLTLKRYAFNLHRVDALESYLFLCDLWD